MGLRYIFTLILFSSFAFASDTILFLDTNSNELEIETARKAAKKAGKKFIAYPAEGVEFNTVRALELVRKTKFTSLVLSGHNGGGSFSGEGEGISYNDIKIALKDNKYSQENTRTLMLLGCNTSNPGQVLNWKEIFPNLDVIAGYDGTGPSQNTVSGLKYIEEVILNSSSWLRQDNEEDLKRAFRRIPYIYNLEAGIYLKHITCDEDNKRQQKEYVFRPLTSGSADQVAYLDFSECPKKLDELRKDIFPKYQKYFLGKEPTGTPTAKAELREVYNFFHQASFCFEDRHITTEDGSYLDPPDWQQVLSLRFWEETQQNIGTFYKDDLEKAYNMLKGIEENPEEIKKGFEKELARLKKSRDYLINLEQNSSLQLREMEVLLSKVKESQIFYDSFWNQNSDFTDKIGEVSFNFLSGDDHEAFMNIVYDASYDPLKFKQKLNALFADSSISKSSKDSLKQVTDEYMKLLNKHMTYENLRGVDVKAVENAIKVIKSDQNKARERISHQIKSEELKISNIQDYLKDDMKKIKRAIKELPVTHLHPEKYSKLSRTEVDKLSHNLSGLSHVFNFSNVRTAQTDHLGDINHFVQHVSWNLETRYIPFSWHENRRTVETPSRRGGTHETRVHHITSFDESEYVVIGDDNHIGESRDRTLNEIAQRFYYD